MAKRQYVWNAGARQYKDPSGRFVARTEVRAALDACRDAAAVEIRTASLELQAGAIDLTEWQLRMERSIKDIHVASGAIAKGGWHQCKESDWGRIGARVKSEYKYLAGFAQELANGMKLDGQFLARAEMYGLAGTGTYEAILRRDDIRAGYDLEMRVTNSGRPCSDCSRYAAMGWQPAGELPGIGQRCQCRSRCQCTFERARSSERSLSRLRRSAMPTGFNRKNCARRNRFAATKGIETAEMRFLRGAPTTVGRLERASGTLPSTEAEALAIINRMRTPGSRELTAEDVYIHYCEAANTNFVSDRYAHLASSTIRNLAVDASQGRAFMNSHRTGGLSHPAELPFGQTFAGRWERYKTDDGVKHERALIGLYMLRGQKPAGDAGPTTDAMHANIEAGIFKDVSVGLDGGEIECDVCGKDLARQECDHAPGTTAGMTDAQKDKQAERGIPFGRASYTIRDAGMREVSAVYDGAVPGAGFSRAVKLARSKAPLPLKTRRELTQAYGRLGIGEVLARRRDRDSGGSDMAVKLTKILRLLGFSARDVDPEILAETERELNRQLGGRKPARRTRPAIVEDDDDQTEFDAAPTARERELTAENARLKKESEARELAAYTEIAGTIAERAQEFAAQAVKANRILPRAATQLASMWAFAALADRGLSDRFTVSFNQTTRKFEALAIEKGATPAGNRRKMVEEFVVALPAHNLTSEAIDIEDDDADDSDDLDLRSRDIFGDGRTKTLAPKNVGDRSLAADLDSVAKFAERRNAAKGRGRNGDQN